MKRHLSVTVFGRVQGVMFRDATQRKARKLGIMGFVRNESGGSVHIEAEGNEEILKNFLAWCGRGSFFSRVERVEEVWSDELRGFDDFVIEYTS